LHFHYNIDLISELFYSINIGNYAEPLVAPTYPPRTRYGPDECVVKAMRGLRVANLVC
jgi:hypothetical protein